MSDAKDLFSQGRDLRARGDCAGAIVLFRKAHDLYPAGLGSLRNMAECQEALGQYASARRSWLDLKRDLLSNSSPKYESWQQDADQAAARLKPKLSTIRIELNVARPTGEKAPSEGIELSLNGEPIAISLAGTSLERDPGHYVARVGGARVHPTEERTIDLAAGDNKVLTFRVVVTESSAASAPGSTSPTLAPERSSPTPVPGPGSTTASPGPKPLRPAATGASVSASGGVLPQEPVAPESASVDSTERTAGWISIGVGAASLVGTGISASIYLSALGHVDSTCSSHTQCDPSLVSSQNQGRTAATFFNVLLPVGLVGIAGGTVLLVMSGRHNSNATVGVAISPTGLWATGRF